MNYLRYSSNEMFSSTELIRKSKMIFDKLNKKEIEKAIILRDGKPGFMLLDFATYEKIMQEYIELKSNQGQSASESYMSLDEIKVEHKINEPKTSMKKVEEQIKVVEDILVEANKHAKIITTRKTEVQAIEKKDSITQIEQIKSEEINDQELQKALDEIEKMNMSENDKQEKKSIDVKNTIDDDFEMSLKDTNKPIQEQPLKEFWD